MESYNIIIIQELKNTCKFSRLLLVIHKEQQLHVERCCFSVCCWFPPLPFLGKKWHRQKQNQELEDSQYFPLQRINPLITLQTSKMHICYPDMYSLMLFIACICAGKQQQAYEAVKSNCLKTTSVLKYHKHKKSEIASVIIQMFYVIHLAPQFACT